MDWILTHPVPVEPQAPVRGDDMTDTAWQQAQDVYKASKESYDLVMIKWKPANKKCVAVVENTVEPTILGAITDYHNVVEYLAKIKNQYTGSSKIYAHQLLEQLVGVQYRGGGLREFIHRLVNINNKLKPMNLQFNEGHIVYLI
ncbi:hypothetical protein, partial [Robertmurraya kyonggiensis]|uniref:hypothetical protein n=1 Tax=Robertmurraya kyonggiensis TaxID=1037680 RepID=UPI00130E39F4